MARRHFRFRPWMLNGHPGNITRACKRVIVRGVNHGLVVTSTTDGQHAPTSWHRFGKAVDFGLRRDLVGTAEGRARMVKFQRFLVKRKRRFHEVFGPDNTLNVKNGRRITLPDGSPLEDQHDNHVHAAPRALIPWPVPRVARDVLLARRARRAGAKHALKTIRLARRVGVPISWAFALVDQESGFRNIFGHDRGSILHGLPVTPGRVAILLRHVNDGGASNGVGLTQLTWPPYIKRAQRQGGAHKPKVQIAVGLDILKQVSGGDYRGRAWQYNGARSYQAQIAAKQARWHRVLGG
jgi:hypothetical protein